MTIKPIGLRVLIKTVENYEKEQTTSFGLVLPDSAKEKPEIAEVVAVGDGKDSEGKTHDMLVKEGDQVIVSKYAGTKVTVDEIEYTIVERDDILAKVEA